MISQSKTQINIVKSNLVPSFQSHDRYANISGRSSKKENINTHIPLITLIPQAPIILTDMLQKCNQTLEWIGYTFFINAIIKTYFDRFITDNHHNGRRQF